MHALAGIFCSPFSLMLVFLPLGIAAGLLAWDCQYKFWYNFFALIPLSKILGDATEELDANLHNEVVSGLINATLGNAVEMIITIMSLNKAMIYVVQASLLGSVLSNMLLVLGMSFFFGGIMGPTAPSGATRLVAEREQSFQVNSALCSVSMLLLASLSLALPTVFVASDPENHEPFLLPLSRVGSVIFAVTYIAYLIFQLATHKNMFANEEENEKNGEEAIEEQGAAKEGSDLGTESAEAENLSLELSLSLLALTTLLVAWSSEYLVDAVQELSVSESSMGQAFIATILLPIVGNACEHMAAVRFAIADKPGLAVSIAVGSSTQIALFVVPFSVICGWMMDKPMELNFGMLNTSVMVLSVIIVMSMVSDGRSNWLEGWMLMSAYVFISTMYWFVVITDSADSEL